MSLPLKPSAFPTRMLQMLHPVTLPSIHRTLSPRHLRRSLSLSAVAMSATTVEHVVLFDIKPEASPAQVESMVSSLRSLSALPHVSHLSCGPIRRLRSPLPFSHLLHARYPSKPDLAAYSAHPSHVSAVRTHVLPIARDIMAVDWLSPVPAAPLPPGAAARLTFAKIGEAAGEEGKAEVTRVLGEVEADAGDLGIRQVSFGENFSPERAKGFSLAMMAVFEGVEGLEKLDGAAAAVEAKKEKVRPFLDGVIVVDFVVPTTETAPASL